MVDDCSAFLYAVADFADHSFGRQPSAERAEDELPASAPERLSESKSGKSLGYDFPLYFGYDFFLTGSSF